MNPLTARLTRRVVQDFGGDAAGVLGRLAGLELIGRVDVERVLAAVVISAEGDRGRLDAAVRLAALDWRDTLVATGLGAEDWSHRLDEELGVP